MVGGGQLGGLLLRINVLSCSMGELRVRVHLHEVHVRSVVSVLGRGAELCSASLLLVIWIVLVFPVERFCLR